MFRAGADVCFHSCGRRFFQVPVKGVDIAVAPVFDCDETEKLENTPEKQDPQKDHRDPQRL
jgi:hypothetical protein